MDTTDLKGLLVSAASDNEVCPSTTALLTDASTLRQINRGDGITADEYTGSEVYIVTLLVDDSGSIFEQREDKQTKKFYSNEEAVCLGHNEILGALLGTKKRGSTIVSTRLLNGGVVSPYVMLEHAPRLEAGKNFVDGGATPLMDQMVVVIGSVLAKAREFEDAGIVVRTWTLVVTDGRDYGSTKASAADVANLAGSLNSEQHQLLGLGVSDGRTDFKEEFRNLGVVKLILSTNDPSAIRSAMRLASQSAAAMNQPSAVSGGLGGFGA